MDRSSSDAAPVDAEARAQYYARFGQAVRRARTEQGMTQTDIGTALGLTRASVANIEAGRQQSALHTAALLAHHLALPLKDLVPEVPTDDAPAALLPHATARVRSDLARVLASSSTQPTRAGGGE